MPLLTIEAIENAGPDKRARRLVFSGQQDPRVTALCVVKALGLRDGQTVDWPKLERDIEEEERFQARERAVRLLGYRERSVLELRRRLDWDGYPSATVSSLIQRFVDLGLLDDERFAALYAAGRVRAGFGSRRIARELNERGVPDDIVAAVVESHEISQVEQAVSALRGKVPTTRVESERLFRKLVGKGFDFAVAREALDRVSRDVDVSGGDGG